MKYKCTICKYEYDPAQGDPTQGIAPGTPFEQLPADWKCPRCKQGKEKFVPVEEPKPANPYAGTQTEKNLHAAFAGESEARNKYTYFGRLPPSSCRPPRTRRSTPSCGSRS